MASDYIDRGDYYAGGSKQPSRPVDKDKVEAELAQNIKKATTTDETAPKAKHVRKLVLYTHDFQSSASIWNGLRVLPILSDEVSTFKALITIHKCLKEAQNNTAWLETCGRALGGDGQRGYGALIRSYVQLLLAKLRFHRHHREFNGLFDYEEYVTLKKIDDPNEGYEAITDLMQLQDQIDSFQKLIFAHFRGSTNNECRISALVPLVKESYGIYRFITSMMRALHRRAGLDASDALEPLRDRFVGQHYNLRKFYYECSNLKYLTSVINVPKLPQEPPSLVDGPIDGPELPSRQGPAQTPIPRAPSVNVDEQARMLQEFEDKKKAEQASLQQQREAEQRRLAEQQARQESEFAEAQRLQAERERQAQEELARQQMAMMSSGRQQELEREILAMRGQYERDQMMLEQYDRRVKALETELAGIGANVQAQLNSKDELLKSLQDQVNLWRNKYEALAKLYTQLRTEHLELLARQKQMALKANSAQESIDKMERMERDVKAKNLELADMIRERDRARFETDRLKSSHKDELERLRRDLRFAEERAEDATSHKDSEVSNLLKKYNRQLTELEESLRSKQLQIDDLLAKLDQQVAETEHLREAKDQEIQILNQGLEQTMGHLANTHGAQSEADKEVNAQMESILLAQHNKLNAIIDSILQACMSKIDDGLYDLESAMSVGNTNATPELTLSAIEQASTSLYEFSSTFQSYVGGEKGGEHVDVIKTANALAQVMTEVLADSKGITRLAADDDASDKLIQKAKAPGDSIIRFMSALQSDRLQGSTVQSKKDKIDGLNATAQTALQGLSSAVEQLVPKSKSLSSTNGNIGDMVEQEMSAAARAIEDATQKLQAIMNRPRDRYSSIDIQVHDTILAAAMAITGAIGRLIQAAASNQQEIVAQGRGSSTSQAFYKRNNRWTEGLLSAARSVAWATTTLIEVADGVVTGHKTFDQLIVASNEVAAATAQLVQASRVKSAFMSKTQEKLELAAKAVTDACKALVKQVKAITAKQTLAAEDVPDYANMGNQEFKIREMEAQVAIVSFERQLTDARRKLADMRKHGYHEDDTS